MPEQTQIELGGERIDVVLYEDGVVHAAINELSDFGKAIEKYCDDIRQDDVIRNDGVAHIPGENIDTVLEEIANADVTLEAYEESTKSNPEDIKYCISWSEPT